MLVVIIALGVLVLLARFRFPAADMSLVSTMRGRSPAWPRGRPSTTWPQRSRPVEPCQPCDRRGPSRGHRGAAAGSIRRTCFVAVGGTRRHGKRGRRRPCPSRACNPPARPRGSRRSCWCPPACDPCRAPGLVGPSRTSYTTRRGDFARGIGTGPETSVSTPAGIDGFPGLSYAGLSKRHGRGDDAAGVHGRVDPSPDNRWPRPLFSIGASVRILATAHSCSRDRRTAHWHVIVTATALAIVPARRLKPSSSS